jgi:uncharacterized membrane protein YfcA
MPWFEQLSSDRLLFEQVFIFVAGLLAGAVNAIAGGGTLLTFPALVWLGRDPITANATNALSLWPGSLAGAYALRRETAEAGPLLRYLIPASVIGSLIGGLLLLATPVRVFSGIAPYLVLFATLLLAAQRPLARLLPAVDHARVPEGRTLVWLFATQVLTSIYGGYFGAATGIIMLATLSLFGVADIHTRNGVKNVLATLNNGVSGIYFALSGVITWSDALVLSVSCVLGGYLGGAFSRRLSKRVIEGLVLAIGVVASVALATKNH